MKKIVRKYESVMHGPYQKMSVKYGIATGVIMSLVLLIRFIVKMPADSPLSMVDNIALLACMIAAGVHYKTKLEDNKITFKELFLLTFYSACIASVVYGVFMYFYARSIDTQMSVRCMQKLMNIPEYSSYTKEQFESMSGYSALALQAVVFNIVMGILWAFVSGIILRNEKSSVK
ncbi:MAG: DUF4199 domain-containing protein [Bacteroidales bacterium]|nr:DUF4199 domain-containing protein [Bacteroidales bacterium]